MCHDSDPNDVGECSDQCAIYLAKVFKASKGAALRSCTCWKQDPLCTHLKQTLLDKCSLKAGAVLDNTLDNKTIDKQQPEKKENDVDNNSVIGENDQGSSGEPSPVSETKDEENSAAGSHLSQTSVMVLMAICAVMCYFGVY